MDAKDEVESLRTRVEDLTDDVTRLRNMLQNESSQNSQLATIEGVNSERTRTFIANSKAEQRALQVKLTALEKQNKRLEFSLEESKSRAEALQDKVELVESEKGLLKASLHDMETAKKALDSKAENLEREQLRLLSMLHENNPQFKAR